MASGQEWQEAALPDGILQFTDRGSGEPVLLIPTALTADEFAPVADRLVRTGRYRVLTYRRRGYGGSSPAHDAASIERDAQDCDRLLAVLGVDRCHVAGLSYSAAVAIELALAAPERVASLTLIEPPPLFVPSTHRFVAACRELQAAYRASGPTVALDDFHRRLVGPDWRDVLERQVPGSAVQAERDAATFFSSDIPALLRWRFDEETARQIECPVLHIGGTRSDPWFAEVRSRLLAWVPGVRDARIDGADHSLAFTHPDEIGAAMGAFLHEQPRISSRP